MKKHITKFFFLLVFFFSAIPSAFAKLGGGGWKYDYRVGSWGIYGDDSSTVLLGYFSFEFPLSPPVTTILFFSILILISVGFITGKILISRRK